MIVETNYEAIIGWFKVQNLIDTEVRLLKAHENLYRSGAKMLQNFGKKCLQDMYKAYCSVRGLKTPLLSKENIKIGWY
jgi:hypothetical protein